MKEIERHLADTFLTLVQEKPLEAISIAYLCQCAKVNRSTFYYYYENLDHFIRRLEDYFLENILPFIQYLTRLIDHTLSSEDICYIETFLESYGNYILFFSQRLTTFSSFQRLLKMYQHNLDTNITIRTLNPSEPIKARYVQEYFFYGQLWLWGNWLKNGKDLPLENFLALNQELMYFGTLKALKKYY